MSKIQIICSSPGLRRNGIEHQASAVYDEGRWTEKQLDVFRADPAFIVQQVAADGGVGLSGLDFDEAVNKKVAEKIEALSSALQSSFEVAVADKARERIEALETRIAEREAAISLTEIEVEKRLKDKEDALQSSFDTAVTEKANERVEALEAKVSELTTKLEAATKKTTAKS